MRPPPDLTPLPSLLDRRRGLRDLTRHQVDGALTTGRLTRVRRGLYAVPTRWETIPPHDWHAAVAAAVSTSDPGAVLSHVTAALAWRLPNPRTIEPRVQLTVTGRARTSRADSAVLLHRAGLPHRHRATVDGLAVTSPSRTVLDCFRTLPRGDALAIADAAFRRGLLGPLELEDALDVAHRWPFLDRAHRGIPLIDPRRENWLESYSAASLAAHQVPLATPQVTIYAPDGTFVARVDGLWEGLGVVGEADGAGKYLGDFDASGDRTPDAVARRVIAAGARESRLRDLGFGVVRWDPREITSDAARVAARFRAACASTDLGRIRALIRHDGASTATSYPPLR